jgi:hypothetical protein
MTTSPNLQNLVYYLTHIVLGEQERCGVTRGVITVCEVVVFDTASGCATSLGVADLGRP